MEKDNERKGSKGTETQIISIERRARLTLVFTQQLVECCLKSCKQADFEEAWKHEQDRKSVV